MPDLIENSLGRDLAVSLLHIMNLRSPYAGPFSLDLAAGECVSVLGPSGSGKTALLRMIADLDPNMGEVSLSGRLREKWPGPAWRRQVIYQAAEPAWWEATAAQHFSSPEQEEIALALLPQLGLEAGLLKNDIARLSTGERQRMALVRSLVHQPKILLLDEPTSALDRDSGMMVEALLQERLQEGLAIVLVTHSPEQARRISHRMLRVQDRGLVPYETD